MKIIVSFRKEASCPETEDLASSCSIGKGVGEEGKEKPNVWCKKKHTLLWKNNALQLLCYGDGGGTSGGMGTRGHGGMRKIGRKSDVLIRYKCKLGISNWIELLRHFGLKKRTLQQWWYIIRRPCRRWNFCHSIRVRWVFASFQPKLPQFQVHVLR